METITKDVRALEATCAAIAWPSHLDDLPDHASNSYACLFDSVENYWLTRHLTSTIMEAVDIEEKIPFLGEDKDKCWPFNDPDNQKTLILVTRLRCKLILSIIANAVLLGISISLSLVLLVLALSRAQTIQALPEPYSPANAAINYEYVPMVMNDTRFVGPPDSVWEESMHKLLDGTLIRISDEELQTLGETSVAFRDGGYAAGLGVAHNLHCVKRIKQFLYRENFYPDLHPGAAFQKIQLHADHCLDFIRQSLMCHADFTTYTLEWGDNDQNPRHRTPELQKCVNWNKLQAWMQSRATSSDMFVRPDEE